jgi:protein-disulfide isomerase
VNRSTPQPATSKAAATTRRQRRAAARRDQRETPRRKGQSTSRARWKSPLVLLTVGALSVGLVIIGVLAMLPGNAPADTALAGDVMVPTELPPAELVSGRSLGRADAPVTLTLWSDFQCPACRMLAQAVEPRLIRDYVATGKLRIDYHDLTIIGPESVDAAVGARCAAEQNRFWDYHGVLYANQAAENSGAITRDRLVAFADRLGLDRPSFEECLDGGHLPGLVQAESASASSRFKSTPTLEFGDGSVINGVPSWETLSTKLDTMIAAAEAG